MIIIDVEAKSKKWLDSEKYPQAQDAKKFVQKICRQLIFLTVLNSGLKKIPEKKVKLEVAVSLVSGRQMKKINFQFRNKNQATNVLSFPALDKDLSHKSLIKKAAGPNKYFFLGDIVICYETIKKESLAQKKKFHDHLTHMILHSILHLLGYDHENEKMAKIMENLEIKILRKLKIKNPYS
jgi:probable rRNA maturation factor